MLFGSLFCLPKCGPISGSSEKGSPQDVDTNHRKCGLFSIRRCMMTRRLACCVCHYWLMGFWLSMDNRSIRRWYAVCRWCELSDYDFRGWRSGGQFLRYNSHPTSKSGKWRYQGRRRNRRRKPRTVRTVRQDRSFSRSGLLPAPGVATYGLLRYLNRQGH